MASKELITKTLRLLAEMTSKEISTGLLALYCSLLDDIPDAEFTAACRAWAETSRWFPTVADIRNKATELSMARDGIPSAHEAWMLVREGNRANMPPLALSVYQAIGGWDNYTFRNWSTVDEASNRKRFIDAYEEEITNERRNRTMSAATKEAAGLLPAETDERTNNAIKQLYQGMKADDDV